MKQPNVFGKMFEGEPAGKPLDAGRGKGRREDQRETAGRRERKEREGEPAGNRWTQGGEGEGGKEGGREDRRGNRWMQGGEREGGRKEES